MLRMVDHARCSLTLGAGRNPQFLLISFRVGEASRPLISSTDHGKQPTWSVPLPAADNLLIRFVVPSRIPIRLRVPSAFGD